MGSSFEPPIQYLRECSDNSLRHFELAKLEHVANLRRELHVLWDEVLEEASLAVLARWMLEHRSYLRSRVAGAESALSTLGEPLAPTVPPADCGPRPIGDQPASLQAPAEAASGPVLVEAARRPTPVTRDEVSRTAGEQAAEAGVRPRRASRGKGS